MMSVLEDKSRARLFYRYLSRVYDYINPFFWNEEMRSDALSMINIKQDDRVLDVGCGTGFSIEGLVQYSDYIQGIDQSAHQLEKAFEKFGEQESVELHQGDAERLPFRDDSFDVVWSSGSIEYWPNPVETLQEIRRITKPGNQVLIVGPDEPQNAILRMISNRIMLFYGKKEADRMFSEAGFVDIEHRILQRTPSSPRAIVTIAKAPEASGLAE
jgi:ubiquinone/menaquinone biosynthesis C-methylase UbiE